MGKSTEAEVFTPANTAHATANLEHLDKLRAESQLTSAEQNRIATAVGVREALFIPPILVGGMAYGTTPLLVGSKAAQTVEEIKDKLSEKQLSRESALIKNDFANELSPDKIKSIEKGCQPSTKDKVGTYGMDVVGDGAYGGIGGLMLSPWTGGWSIPALALGGMGSGYMRARESLKNQELQCEVKAYRNTLTSW